MGIKFSLPDFDPWTIETEYKPWKAGVDEEARFTVEFFGVTVYQSPWIKDLDLHYQEDDIKQAAQDQLGKILTELLRLDERITLTEWGTLNVR